MGTAVGLERQWWQRMAGTRTDALVAAGAAAFVMCAFMVRDTDRGVPYALPDLKSHTSGP
jgi:putative Mg2+ transporter-C (MgtC) family protein